jgi:hypothetical protein
MDPSIPVSPSNSPVDGERASGVRRRSLVVLSATVALSAFDRLLIAPLLTSIASGLAVSIGASCWYQGAFYLVWAGADRARLAVKPNRTGPLAEVRPPRSCAGQHRRRGCPMACRLDRRAIRRRRGFAGLAPGAVVLLADESGGASRARKQAASIAALVAALHSRRSWVSPAAPAIGGRPSR